MSAPLTERAIGRDAELHVLHEALADARAGVFRCVAVSGEAGMGKTRLLNEFRSSLDADTVVLSAGCIDLGQFGMPFAPLRSLVSQLAAVVGAQELLAEAGPGGPAIGALLPALADGQQSGEEPLHETLVDLLGAFSRVRPIVVLLDDAQWVDAATLSVLRYVLRTLSAERVVVVLSYRSEDTGRAHPLRHALAELDRERVVTRRELHGLDGADTAALVTRLRGSEPDRETVTSIGLRSQGIPFFIEELVGLESDEIPDSLRDVLLARYFDLDAVEQAMLRALAVGGLRVSYDLLREISDRADIDTVMRSAADAVLVLAAEDGYAFRHALVREAVLGELLPGERRDLHERYAVALTAGGATASETSFHWLAAHDLPRSLETSLSAFDEAVAGRAYASALQFGERALGLWDQVADPEQCAACTRATLLVRVTTAAVDGGDRTRGLAWVGEAIAAADPFDARGHVELLRIKAALLSDEGLPGAEAALVEALQLLGDDDSELALRARVQLSLTGRLELTGRMEDARALLGPAFDNATRSGDRAAISCALQWMSGLAMEDNDVEAALEMLDRAFLYADDGVPLLLWSANTISTLVELGEYRAAVQVAAWPLQHACELGLERSWGIILAGKADALLALGRWGEAVADVERAAAMQPSTSILAFLHRQRIFVANWQDDTASASAIARDNHDVLATFAVGDFQDTLPSAAALGELALFRGELDDAWRRVSVLWRPVHQGTTGDDMPLVALAARIVGEFRRTGHGTPIGALENIDGVFDRAASWPIVSRWRALVEAELAESRGHGLDIDPWVVATDALAHESMPAHLRAYAWWRRGEAELSGGDRSAATQSLRTAEEQADRIGALWVSRRVRELQLTAALGERSRGYRNRLTARESQVLDLVAEGLTNREISQRLFISTKTASTHVSAILRKLGATTRTQAAVIGGRSPQPASAGTAGSGQG